MKKTIIKEKFCGKEVTVFRVEINVSIHGINSNIIIKKESLAKLPNSFTGLKF